MATKKQESTPVNDLKTQITQKRVELEKAILEKNLGRLKNTRSVFHLKKDIARLLTKLNSN
jgi:ribosomal protein L29